MDLERRQNIRFHIREQAFAADSSSGTMIGKIVDVGNDGLAFVYSEDENLSEEFKAFSIYVPGHGYCLKNTAVKLIYDIDHKNKTTEDKDRTLRRGIKFKTLTSSQADELEEFIFYHTTII